MTRPLPSGPRDERGMALVVALLVLMVLSVLMTVLLATVNVDTKITSHAQRETEALNAAEAGLSEATSRIRSFEISDALAQNPRRVAQIFRTEMGTVPVLGADSIGFATRQPAGSWLPYSSASRGPNVLTVEYKTNPAKTTIYRYDNTRNPMVGPYASGYPVYVVTSTGIVGNDIRRIRAEIVQKPVRVVAQGAMVAKVGIDFSGQAYICGYNHRMDTPYTVDSWAECQAYHTGSGDLAGVWSESPVTVIGASQQYGNPAISGSNGTGFYTGPWDVFTMTQSEFFSWLGPSVSVEPLPPQGIYYLDNNAIAGDQSGSFAFHGTDGDGLLYIDGSMSINGNFTFRGLVYIEGDLNINGTCWILGGLIVHGKTTVKISNGSCVVLYSSDAIEQNITKYGGQFATLSWRELN